MPPYETRILDPSEYDDTELGSEVRAAWAEGVRVIELVEPRTLVTHVHDWRADPAGHVYLSHPPKWKLVCATCGEVTYKSAPMPAPVPRDPRDWPRAAR